MADAAAPGAEGRSAVQEEEDPVFFVQGVEVRRSQIDDMAIGRMREEEYDAWCQYQARLEQG
jgi:hypothetical protein